MIIQKFVSQLQQGDVLAPIMPGGPRHAVLTVRLPGDGFVAFDLGRLGPDEPGFAPTPQLRSETWAAGGKVDVEVPDLTPAQLHADELREALWMAANKLREYGLDDRELRALLDRIDPPKPPTLAEALQLLAQVRDPEAVDGDTPWPRRADDLLERARRAGVL